MSRVRIEGRMLLEKCCWEFQEGGNQRREEQRKTRDLNVQVVSAVTERGKHGLLLERPLKIRLWS